MSKAKARRKGSGRGNNVRIQQVQHAPTTHSENGLAKRKSSMVQGIVMNAMITLGCWGMAISFIFFTTDPNRFLYGGMAAALALLWSFNLGLRLRKSSLQQK